MNAALYGDLEMAKELLDHGAKPDFRVPQDGGYMPTTALLDAALGNHMDIIRLLLKRGANPNIKMGTGESPLTDVVTEGGNTDSIRVLLDAGLNPNVGESLGNTPLSRAAMLTDGKDLVKLLLAHGAHVNGKFSGRVTPLMNAAEGGNIASFGLILNAGADIKAQDESGDSVLIHAVKSGKPEMVAIVIAEFNRTHGDLNIRDHENKTALSFALDQHNDEITQILKVAGAVE
jgi:ankyrin repeat protein